jgi:hypothetical protein
MARAGIRRFQAPNLCHAEAKIGPERDISLPRCRCLTSRRSSRTAAPKSGQSPGMVFTQPGSRTAIGQGRWHYDQGVIDRTLGRSCDTSYLDDDEAAEYPRGYSATSSNAWFKATSGMVKAVTDGKLVLSHPPMSPFLKGENSAPEAAAVANSCP